MNNLDYASFEASKKLHDAGIMLETEKYWAWDNDKRYISHIPRLMNKGGANSHNNMIPALSMAEAWRELPECITKGGTIQYLEMGKTGSKTYAAYDFADDYILFDNPTDALIDLLIWVKEQNKDRIVNKLLDRADKLKW